MPSQAHFIQQANLVGRTITGVRYMTAAEARALGWMGKPVVLTLDNGSLLYPQKDDESNDANCLIQQQPDGNTDHSFPVF